MKEGKNLDALPVFSEESCSYGIDGRIKYTIDYLGFRGCYPEHFTGAAAALWAAEQWANSVSQGNDPSELDDDKNATQRAGVEEGFRLAGIGERP